MSSVTMAADSTQAEIIHHRVRPVVKAAASAATVPLGFGRGRRQVHRREHSRSRRRSSSSRSHKQKRRSRERQVRKDRRRHNGSQSRSHDDTSDRDSDLDLSKDLLPISGYVRIKDEMVDHMFRSISNRKLRAMLPEILRPLSSDELKKLCIEQLEVMSKKRICRILDGADPETISSSGTEEEDEEDEESSSGKSTDAEDGPEVGGACADNEAVGSTFLHAKDDLPVKNSHINSSENKEVPGEFGKDGRLEESGDAPRDGEMEEEGEVLAVTEKTSRIDDVGLDGDEIFGITIKVNEARFRLDDPESSADAGGGCGLEESVKMNKRNIERSYRAKQLDDDERENESDGGGVKEGSLVEEGGLGVAKTSRSKPKEGEEEPSDNESIPISLPPLDSEPEETCCPFDFMDTKFSQELKNAVELDQKGASFTSSENSPQTTVITGGKESKEVNVDCESFISLATGKISSLDKLVCPDGTPADNEITRERKGAFEEHAPSVSEHENVDSPRKESCPAQLRTWTSGVESVNDGEEMVIEIQEHEEFSDDIGDDGDVSYEREKEKRGKKTDDDSAKDNEVLTNVTRLKNAAISDDQFKDDETELFDDKRLALAEKLEKENYRGLPVEEDSSTSAGETLIRESCRAAESRQQGLKRKSVEIADEQLQSKIQKHGDRATAGESRSEERSDSNSEQKKCVRTKTLGLTDGKTTSASKVGLNQETKLSSLSSLETCRQPEGGATVARTSALQLAAKRESSLSPCSSEQNLGKSPSQLSRASVTEETSNRKVISGMNKGLPVGASSARPRVERPEVQISSSRVESSQSVEVTGRATASKTPNRTPSHQKPSAADNLSPSDASKEPSTPILSKTQLEILELEMRARAIKAMLKAQEELEKREEKLKTDEKRRSVVSSASQLPRSAQATESRSVVRPEAKITRIGTSYREEALTGPKTVGAVNSAQRVVRRDVATPRQSQDKRLVERRPVATLSEETLSTRTVQANRPSVARPGFKSFRDVVASNRFPTSAYRLTKRPLTSATRGRGGGAGGSCVSTRIVRLSGGPRMDSRSVVPAPKPVAVRRTSGGPGKTARLAMGDREDVRRVVASLPASARCGKALKATDSSLRWYGHRDREHGSSPNRDHKRSVVAWNRRVNYKQQASKAGRF